MQLMFSIQEWNYSRSSVYSTFCNKTEGKQGTNEIHTAFLVK
jgi:hypothetical protein